MVQDKKGYNVRDQHSNNHANKLFLKLHNIASDVFTDAQIAKATGIAHSTYGKIKLGYYPAYDYRIKALQTFVDSIT